ncbi:hypothetical protein FHG87_011240 [Trinorchestia longiramus]|nr:hypothetical protein FHG87_011240 [Trinorchestia longiramus]
MRPTGGSLRLGSVIFSDPSSDYAYKVKFYTNQAIATNVLTWVRSSPRGSMSQSQEFGEGQDAHPTHVIRDDTPRLAIIGCREFGALSNRLLTVVMTPCICKQSFSRMLDIKTKKRNTLCCENNVRVALAKVKPRISELVSETEQ